MNFIKNSEDVLRKESLAKISFGKRNEPDSETMQGIQDIKDRESCSLNGNTTLVHSTEHLKHCNNVQFYYYLCVFPL